MGQRHLVPAAWLATMGALTPTSAASAAATSEASGTATAAAAATRSHASAPGKAEEAPRVSSHAYLQYGVGLAAETVVSAGPLCVDTANCILGSGGGIGVRAGWRPTDELYLGGAYEASKQDSALLYRLGVLQQARFEMRRYFPTGRQTTPFALLGAGVQAYGNEWSFETWGVGGAVGGGIEVELGGPVLELSLAYRPMYFRAWVDSSTLSHQAGVAHLVGLEVALEAKDSL